MTIKSAIAIVMFLCCCHLALSQHRDSLRVVPSRDSLVVSSRPVIDLHAAFPDTYESEKTRRFYDSLRMKSHRRAVPRFFHDLLIVRPKKDTTDRGRIIDETEIYKPFEDKIISEIFIIKGDVFDKDTGLLGFGNRVHYNTRKKTIRRDLLFKPGDVIDAEEIVRNKQILKSRSYTSDVEILMQESLLDSAMVEVYVLVRDRWTISLDGYWRRWGRTMLGVYDANFLGTGNRLSIRTNFDRKNYKYEGNIVEYDIPNIRGTFYRAHLAAGANFDERILNIGMRKDFIYPTDYDVGFTAALEKDAHYQTHLDTTTLVSFKSIDVWSGKSKFIEGINSSVYLTARYSFGRFNDRPDDTGPFYNPAFHSYDRALFGLGIYREKFYSANLIYGFRYREYLASGYKAELIGGYSWGEFHNEWYFGSSISAGGFIGFGYLTHTLSIGSFYNNFTKKWHRGGLDGRLQWFSPLFSKYRTRIRQFVTLDYTKGWRRDGGSDEWIRFNKYNGPRAIKEHIYGRHRAALNTETVFFTPLRPYNFQTAFFGFADFGFIGNHANIFRNRFFSSLGVGIRLRNERLIFNTIQFRFGIAFGRNGLIDSRMFTLDSEQRINAPRFMPAYPEIVGYE